MSQKISKDESNADFNQFLSRLVDIPVKDGQQKILTASRYDSVLGPMLILADEHKLHLLEFFGRRALDREIKQLQQKLQAKIVSGSTAAINSIQNELKLYFEGKLKVFKTPLTVLGTPFQKQVWDELQKIPYGETRSYSDIAAGLGRPKAFRAAANANGCNQLAIIIPCHRVINSSGALGGYAGGLEKKNGF